MKNNPYIELVKNHDKILSLSDEISSHSGKWSDYFGNSNDLVLEIGTGLGNFFSKQVNENPGKNYVGMEIRYKRLHQTAEKCLGNKSNYAQTHKTPLPLDGKEGVGGWNLSPNFILLKEFGEKVGDIFGAGELSETYIFFPDPWDRKKAQLKNRLLQKKFLLDLYEVTKLGGILIIKTDHAGYFDFLLAELKTTSWQQRYISFDFENEPEFQNSETTEFQQLFRGQEQQIHHIELRK